MTITITLRTAKGRPTFPISHRPIEPIPASSISPDTTRFVDVPMSVTVPPTTAAKLIGMR